MSASVSRTPRSTPAPLPGEYARIGTYSREWSVVSQRKSGSHPWSAVIISRSESVSSGKKGIQQAIEFFQRFRESFYVFAMPVQHVEIHEIAENKPVLSLAHRGCQFLHPVGIVFRCDVVLYAAPIVDVVNLADAKHRHRSLLQYIQQHRLRRIDGIIMPPWRAHKIASRRP